jgi:glycosyltransferase involved in cell wall biosynthesis
MRICYLCQDLGISLGGVKGGSAHVRGLVGAFSELGHQVTVLMVGAGDGVVERRLGIRFRKIPMSGIADGIARSVPRRLARALGHLWTNVSVELALESALEAEAPDLVYERYSPFGVAGGAVSRGRDVPHLLEVNAPLAWEGSRYRRQALDEAAQALEGAAFAQAGHIVTVSRELRDTLMEDGVPGDRVSVVPNGVDGALFSPEGPVPEGLRNGGCVVGFVGSLKEWHGVDLMAEAFRTLASDSRFHLLVVGEGPRAEAIGGLAAELPGRVTWTGAVPHGEIPDYVRAMDIALAPVPVLERYYYSPLKVLEYMAMGRPVVAGDIGQLRELVEPGVTGVLVPPGDPDALAGAVQRLADDPEHRLGLGRAAAARVREAHLWTERAHRILQLAEGLQA